MVDLNFIGSDGVVIQFEDIVSLVGYNIANYLKAKKFNDTLQNVNEKELLLNYLNREEYDISKWLSQYDVHLTMDDYAESLSAWQPNLLYSYKICKAAHQNGIKRIKIYSESPIDVIQEFVKYYPVPVEYCHSDLKSHLDVNMTLYTSIPKNIELCKSMNMPLALVIVDDFMYVKDMVHQDYITSLNKKNIFVNFTGILGGGFI